MLNAALVPLPDILVLVTVTSDVVPNGDQSRLTLCSPLSLNPSVVSVISPGGGVGVGDGVGVGLGLGDGVGPPSLPHLINI